MSHCYSIIYHKRKINKWVSRVTNCELGVNYNSWDIFVILAPMRTVTSAWIPPVSSMLLQLYKESWQLYISAFTTHTILSLSSSHSSPPLLFLFTHTLSTFPSAFQVCTMNPAFFSLTIFYSYHPSFSCLLLHLFNRCRKLEP